jgi:hypothetical protein
MIDLGCLKSLCFTETNSYLTGKLVQELQQPATSDSEQQLTTTRSGRTTLQYRYRTSYSTTTSNYIQ